MEPGLSATAVQDWQHQLSQEVVAQIQIGLAEASATSSMTLIQHWLRSGEVTCSELIGISSLWSVPETRIHRHMEVVGK